MSQTPHVSNEEQEVIGHPTLSAWVFGIFLTCAFLAIVFAFGMMIYLAVSGQW